MKKLAFTLALIGLVATSSLAREQVGISLRSGHVDTLSAPSLEAGPDASVRLVKFEGPVSDDQLRALEAAVERVYTYLPDFAFLVRTAEGASSDSLAAAGAIWTGPFLASYKISPEIAAAEAGDPTLRPVMIHVLPDTDLSGVVTSVETLVGRSAEGAVEKDRFSRVRVLLSDAEIASLRDSLAELGEVFWLEREHRKVFKNDTTIWVGQSGTSGGEATPVFDNGILGAGQTVAVLDTGVDIDSCYFWDAANGFPAMNECDGGTDVDLAQRKVIAVDFLRASECAGGISNSEWDTQGHGSHVAGTVAGDDFAVPGAHNNRDGMAPQARLVIQDCGYQTDNCADCPGIGCPVVDLVPIFQQPYDQGARIHTNSWGDEENDPSYGEYTAGSEDADEFMWNHKDFLLLFAAGNNGGTFNTVDSPSTAKNVISVGSTLRGGSADTISGFSSRGPTDDGRIKPDVTNPGSSIQSAGNDQNAASFNCTSASSSGTSMATPGVAGLSSLARQYYMDGFYPSGVANGPDAFTPSAALVKASIINSATQMTGEGDIPNDTQGWGRVLLDNVLFFPSDSRRLFVEDELTGFADGSSGDTFTYDISVAGGEPLEITLAWTDYPSTPAAGTNLVNDLDLEVTGPDGTFLGNVYSGGQSSGGGAADRLNNVESVARFTPTPGLWTVTVRSFNVPEGPQPFALVVTGTICSGAPSVAAVHGSESFVPSGGDADDYLDNCEGSTISFDVENRGVGSAANASVVSVSSPSHPGVVFAPPTWSTPTVASCGVGPMASVELLQANGLSFGDTLLVNVEMTNDEISPATNTTTLEIALTETDLQMVASQLFDFESDLEDWTVSGIFGRDNVLGGAEGSTWYMQSSANLPNQCDVALSPVVQLTATSTLNVFTYYEIEPESPPWYDRANVAIVDDGTSTLVIPDGGRPYDVPNGSDNGNCGTSGEGGWADSNASWAASSFTSTALDASSFAGRPVQFEVRYGTDGGLELPGFRFDRFELTDIETLGPDAQSNVCLATDIFSDGFESGDTSAWSSTVP